MIAGPVLIGPPTHVGNLDGKRGFTCFDVADFYHSPGSKAVEGEDHLPRIVGVPWIANGLYPGWQASAEPFLTDPREAGPDPKEAGRGPLPISMGRFEGVATDRNGFATQVYRGSHPHY